MRDRTGWWILLTFAVLSLCDLAYGGDRWRRRPAPIPIPTPVPVPTPSAPSAAVIHDAQDAARARAGLPPYIRDARLDQAAGLHAQEMARRKVLSHQSEDGSWHTDRATRAGYPWRSLGENAAAHQRTAQECVSDWESSPGHNANLKSTTYRDSGAGVARASDGTYYWCAMYGSTARSQRAEGVFKQGPITKTKRGYVR